MVSPSLVSITTGRFLTTPTPRIPTLGWLIIGVPMVALKTPKFEIENVEPCNSSGMSCLFLVRKAVSLTFRHKPKKLSSSHFSSTGTIRPLFTATAIPIFTFLW